MPSSNVLLPDKPAGPSFPLRLPNAVVSIGLSPSSPLPPDSIDAEDHVSYQEPAVDNIDHLYNRRHLARLARQACQRRPTLPPLLARPSSDASEGQRRDYRALMGSRSTAAQALVRKDQARPGPAALVHLYDRRRM